MRPPVIAVWRFGIVAASAPCAIRDRRLPRAGIVLHRHDRRLAVRRTILRERGPTTFVVRASTDRR
jgi:hypothetical protein